MIVFCITVELQLSDSHLSMYPSCPKLEMTVLLKYSEYSCIALYNTNAWSSVMQTIHLSEQFSHYLSENIEVEITRVHCIQFLLTYSNVIPFQLIRR